MVCTFKNAECFDGIMACIAHEGRVVCAIENAWSALHMIALQCATTARLLSLENSPYATLALMHVSLAHTS